MISMFTPEWFVSLAAIVLIDLLLAGDNAIVITLAARKFPTHIQKKAVLSGGLLLYWTAWHLLAKGDDDPDTSQADTFWSAMCTIIIADTVMGLDNILAIVGASRGDWRTLH